MEKDGVRSRSDRRMSLQGCEFAFDLSSLQAPVFHLAFAVLALELGEGAFDVFGTVPQHDVDESRDFVRSGLDAVRPLHSRQAAAGTCAA